MSTPETEPPPGLAQVASESADESVAAEREVVGDQPDTGGLVDEDDAQ